MSYADIPGYSGFLWLYDEAVTHFGPAGKFVEVGVALGHSLAYLARKRIDAGHPPRLTWGVDPWAGTARNGEQQEALGASKKGDFRLFLDNMLKHAPEELEVINVVRTNSTDAAHFFPMYSLDLVLIDAAHDYDSVTQDIQAWKHTIKVGGWLAGDDFDPKYPGVEAAVRDHFNADDIEIRGTTWRVKL